MKSSIIFTTAFVAGTQAIIVGSQWGKGSFAGFEAPEKLGLDANVFGLDALLKRPSGPGRPNVPNKPDY